MSVIFSKVVKLKVYFQTLEGWRLASVCSPHRRVHPFRFYLFIFCVIEDRKGLLGSGAILLLNGQSFSKTFLAFRKIYSLLFDSVVRCLLCLKRQLSWIHSYGCNEEITR